MTGESNNTQTNSESNETENLSSDSPEQTAPLHIYTGAPIIVTPPETGSDPVSVQVEGEQTYIFDFTPADVQSAYEQDGNLIIKFENNSSVIMENFDAAMAEEFPPSLTLADGTVVDVGELIASFSTVDNAPDQEDLEAQGVIRETALDYDAPDAEEEAGEKDGEGEGETAAQEIASLDNQQKDSTAEEDASAQKLAQKLAEIEPAAGETGGAGRGGFGFQSSFDPQGVIPLEDVGPIGPTALQYGVEFRNETLFPEEGEREQPDDNPIITGPLTEFMDESFLGPLVETGQVLANFGNDGPGTITPNGVFMEGGSLLNGNLTSDGVPVIVSPTANGYEGTAGGTTVFTLVINPNTGEYTFTLLESLEHDDSSDPNDVITLKFGVVATDVDGDAAETDIIISVADDAPLANDDFNNYSVANGGTDGNVITGLNGGAGAADDVSEDVPNTVIDVTFNGNTVIIPDGGSNTINGDFGTLEMFADGTYTYTLFPGAGASSSSLSPVEGDVAGNADTITKNGISVSSFLGDDLSWIDVGAGAGIGTNGKVFGAADGLEIEFDQPADSATITVADIGPNNTGSGIDWVVYLSDGSSVQGEFDIGTVNVVNGLASFTLNGSDFGPGLEIEAIDIFSINNSALGSASFTLHDVVIRNDAPECLHDQFEYTLHDGDGDTDVALLDLKGAFPPVKTNLLVNNGVDDAQVKEDGSVFIPVQAGYTGGNGNETLKLTLNGVDPNWNFAGTNWVATGNPGEFMLTLPTGVQNYNDGFTLTPPADSDVDMNGLTVTADVTGPNAGDNDSASDGFNVITDAVIDTPTLSTQDANGEEGTTIPLSITTAATDTDGSEVIKEIKITNLPPGATLTAGSENGGVWTLSQADLIGLGINIPDGTTGMFVLNVESVATEDPVTDNEVDFTDNETSVFDIIKLKIEKDDEPEIAKEEVTVDETNLAPTTQVSDSIQADFGADTPGIFAGNGGFFSGIALTSGGVPVNVNFDAPSGTYTGTAGGNTIFTLVIESNGDYTFTLEGVLDHPDTTDHNDNIQVEFGITATDSDGDTTDGVITVNVLDDGLTAHDDMNMFNTEDGGTDGNVISGLNGGAGAADDLSNDMPNTVTQIAFGATVKNVPDGGSVTIDGNFGELEIFSNGTYNYTLFDDALSATGGKTFHLDPVASDAEGIQESFTRDGITVSVANNGNFDISWVSTADGSGFGIDNLDTNDSQKIWPKGESFDIDFVEDVSTVTIKIAELGDNNDDGNHGLDYIVTLADGTTVAGEQQFTPGEINNGTFAFTLDSSDYGQLIQSVNIQSTDAGNYKGASILLNNVWAETEGNEIFETHDVFRYTLTDDDGDTSVADLSLWGAVPQLIVGTNTDDDSGSTVPHLVNGDKGVIVGKKGNDILVGDAGGSFQQPQKQDFNVVLILDVSGSMNSSNRIGLMKDAVNNLLADFNGYQSGTIKVHIVPFSTTVQTSGTFTVTEDGDFAAATGFVDGFSASGWTNYESALQDAIAWLQGGDPLNGSAQTLTYFLSDGNPNRYLNDQGDVVNNNSAEVAMDQIDGTSDSTNEIAMIQSLSDEVHGVGISISGATLDRIGQIDSDGNPVDVQDPNDLNNVLQELSPLNKLDAVGDDVIVGKDGGDIIFGDVLFTDDLAALHGLITVNGAGWEVFEHLENGESALNPGWDRDDTIAYIRANAESLAGESVDGQGDGREGGDDDLSGDDGDDLIFGQEGDDLIVGGAGNDMLYGGSGADTFLYDAITDGFDIIKDFDITEGDLLDISALLTQYNPIQDSINDFVFATESGENTTIAVDENGSGNIANATQIALLEGVTGLNIEDATNNGQAVV